jgi:hypothetical protein
MVFGQVLVQLGELVIFFREIPFCLASLDLEFV